MLMILGLHWTVTDSEFLSSECRRGGPAPFRLPIAAAPTAKAAWVSHGGSLSLELPGSGVTVTLARTPGLPVRRPRRPPQAGRRQWPG